MNKRLLPLALVLGLIIGWLIGDRGLSDQVSTSASSDSSLVRAEQHSTSGKPLDTADVITGAVDAATLSLEQKMSRIERLKGVKSLANMIETMNLVASMSEGELHQALEEIGQKGMGSIDDFLMPYYVFMAWVEKNPNGAYDYYQNDANPAQKQMYSQSLFSAWATRDPRGALAAAEAIEDRNQRGMAIAAIAMSMAGTDPEGAFDLLSKRDDLKPWQMQSVFMLWGAQDFDAAMAKVQTVESGAVRTSALAGVLHGIAQTDIVRAADIAMSLDRADERTRSLQTVMHTWISQDIDGAMDFLSGLEDGKEKNDIVQNSI